MSVSISILETQVYTAVKAFLASQLPTGTPIIKGLPNRTSAPPPAPGFVAMTLITRKRLNTNIDTYDTVSDDPTTWDSETHFEVEMQLDIVGDSAFDWCATIESLWRDEVACDAIETSLGGTPGAAGYSPTIDPLYTKDALMAPYEAGEDQYEKRWILRAVLQYNPIVTTPQQFANELGVTVINVDEAYPP